MPSCVVVSCLPFRWFICVQNSTSIPKATVRDHGVGVKVFSKSNQQQCLPEGLFTLQHVGICVYRNVWDRERVFVNVQHGNGVFCGGWDF